MIQSKDIGNYIVYSDGKVWSKYSQDWIKPRIIKNRYTRVKLSNKRIPLHRLIAETFLPNPLNFPEVDHINNNKQDNRIENLQWITKFKNRSKAHQDGLIPYCYGKSNGRSKQNRIKYAQNYSQPIPSI
jgi:hypothetical protein